MKNVIIYFCLASLSVILFSCEKYISAEYPKIVIKSLSDTTVYKGSELTIYGEEFTIFNSYNVHVGNSVLKAIDGTDTSLVVTIPDTISLGGYSIWLSPSFQGGSKFKVQASEKLQFSVITDASVNLTSVSTPLLKGGLLKISGLGFSTNLASNTIFVGDTELKPTSSLLRNLECTLPLTIAEGEYAVKVVVIREDGNAYTSNSMTLNIVAKIITIKELRTPVIQQRASVLLEGENISTNKDEVKVKIGDTEITPSGVSSTSVSFIVPTSIADGTYELKIVSQGIESNAITVEVVSGAYVYLTSATIANDLITVNGTGFSTTLSSNKILLNDLEYDVKTATATTITFKIPEGFVNGEYTLKIKTNGTESLNSKTVTVDIPVPPAPAPEVTEAVYDVDNLKVTLTGLHFGTDQAAVTVTVAATDEANNPTTVTVDSVTDTEIILIVDPALNDDTYTVTVTIGENIATKTFDVTTTPPTP